jgi:hypothetical protein
VGSATTHWGSIYSRERNTHSGERSYTLGECILQGGKAYTVERRQRSDNQRSIHSEEALGKCILWGSGTTQWSAVGEHEAEGA